MMLHPPKNNLKMLDNYGCVLTRDRTRWCFGICKPVKGIGQCGRLYPHALKSRRQRAIAAWQRARREQDPESQAG